MEKRPAKPKKPRGKAKLIEGKCIACGARCQQACPTDAIEMNAQGEPVIDPEECVGCGKCVKVCPADALEMVVPVERAVSAEEESDPADKAETAAADQTTMDGCQGVWVFVEQCQGEAHCVSWELLGVGRILASDLGVELCAFILGSSVTHLSEQAFGYGADKVYLVDDPVLGRYRTEPYLEATVALIRKYTPEIVLMGATGLGRDLAGAVATRLETGLTADCTGLSINKERRLLEQTRPAFGGNIMATILTETARPQMASVRPYVMQCPRWEPGRTGQLVSEPWTLSEDEIATKILEVIPTTSEASVNIAGANVIVSGGRGMLAPENFRLLEDLAHVLGGVVGASRGAVAAGWIQPGRQVGQTGKTVKPRLRQRRRPRRLAADRWRGAERLARGDLGVHHLRRVHACMHACPVFIEHVPKLIALRRHLVMENPSIISVACPYCMTMFEDGLRDENATGRVKVKDVAEVVLEAIR